MYIYGVWSESDGYVYETADSLDYVKFCGLGEYFTIIHLFQVLENCFDLLYDSEHREYLTFRNIIDIFVDALLQYARMLYLITQMYSASKGV